MESPGEVTRLLQQVRLGDQAAFDELVWIVYADLKRIAHFQLLRVAPTGALQTTELVHETYLKLLGQSDPDWEGRRHFLRIAARAMRQVIVDLARRRLAAKRGRGVEPGELDEADLAASPDVVTILVVDQAVEGLTRLGERLGTVVECRFFAGMSEEETAAALGVSHRTVRRDWKQARAWLRRSLDEVRGTTSEDRAD